MNLYFIILFTIILFNLYNKRPIEHYSHWKYLPIHYMNGYKRGFYRVDYVPPIILDSSFSKIPKILDNQTFCYKYPKCYPCYGWKHIGPPYCI